MTITSHSQHSGLFTLIAVAATALVFSTAGHANAAYGWPLKPFHQQHPVRGYFGDPRITGHDIAEATIHFGIDISAPNGTAVYTTIDGIASIHPLHPDVVIVSAAGGIAFEYWHIIPSIHPGQPVVAYQTIVGHIEAPWRHVHFSERHGSTYVNPLRPGALSPYLDTTRPTIHLISFELNGTAVGTRLSGMVDFVVEAADTTPVPVPAPWNDKPVAPALVEWRLVGGRGLTAATPWHVADDFRDALPGVPYPSVYARWTRQNHAWSTARYRFLLARGFDTRSLVNGTYHLVVRVADTAGNARVATRDFTRGEPHMSHRGAGHSDASSANAERPRVIGGSSASVRRGRRDLELLAGCVSRLRPGACAYVSKAECASAGLSFELLATSHGGGPR